MRALNGVYYAAYARARIATAQATVDRHVASAYTGCCVACGRVEPCGDRTAAELVLARYARLPRRVPGRCVP